MARWLVLVLLLTVVLPALGDKTKTGKPKKDIRDYNDADLERLYEEWEDNDEDELPEDEKPEHKRPKPTIDLSKLKAGANPEDVMKMSKKGQSVMMFVTISGTPTKAETEKVAALWQTSLYNNHIEVQNYVIDDNRALFMFKDGSQAWDAKEFLLKQDQCSEVSLEGQQFPGKGAAGKKAKKEL